MKKSQDNSLPQAKRFSFKPALSFLGWVIAISVIAITVFLYSLHFAGLYIQKHNELAAKWISQVMEQSVHFNSIEFNRSGINPEIKLSGVEILDDSGVNSIVKINELYFRISVFKSLLAWQIEPNLLIVSGAKIDLYQGKDFKQNNANRVSKRVQAIAEWLFSQGKIFLNQITVNWHVNEQKNIAVNNLSLQLTNRVDRHNISGMGTIGDSSAAQFKIILNLHGNVLHWENIKADAYLDLQNLSLPELEQYVALPGVNINKGLLDLSSWATWRNNKLEKLQQQFSLHNFAATFSKTKKDLLITRLSGSSLFVPQANGGQVQAQLDNIGFNYDNWFAKPISLDQMQMDMTYSRLQNGWQINATKLNIENSDLKINNVFQLLIPSDNSGPAINLQGKYQINNIVNLPQYYPIGIMSEKLSHWLINSIKSGEGIDGSIELQGAFKDFPFTDNNGKFNIIGNLHKISLYYADGWPNFSDINGVIAFSGKSMAIQASSFMFDLPVNNIKVNIPDLSRSVLIASGETSGDNSYIFQFIKNSPLNASIGKELGRLQASGPMKFSINLVMPLGSTPGATVVKGSVQENGGSVYMSDWKLTVKNIVGAIDFTNNSLSAKKLTASIFDAPTVININTLEQNSKHPVWQFIVDGALNADFIQHNFSCSLLKYLVGKSAYHALLNIHKSDDSLPTTITFISNLRGLAINLPQPFAKDINDPRLFIANLVFAKNRTLNISIKYANKISATLSYLKTDAELKFINGVLHFGAAPNKETAVNGLSISGHLPLLVYAEWSKILQASKDVGANILQDMNLIIDKLSIFGQEFLHTNLLMEKTKDGSEFWIKNQNVDGSINIPSVLTDKYIYAKFTKLELNSSSAVGSSLKPTDILPLHLFVDNLRYHNHYFHNFEIIMKPVSGGVNIEKLNISNNQFKLNATGKWNIQNGIEESALYGTFTTNTLGDFLKTWNITSNLMGGAGNITFSLNWDDALYKPSVSKLNGNLLLQFNNGQIINLSQQTESEIGLGTVLNIFSLQSLPRRLSLDFSDLINKGFVFDVIRGDFTLLNGDAYTTDANLNGTVAHVALNGRIGLVAHDYNLYLTVIPYMTSSLPVIIALAGGPVAGAVTWAADEVFKRTLQKMTAYRYKVTGAWKNPNVVKIGQFEAKNND